MKSASRVPLAVLCLATGGLIGVVVNDRLQGQNPPPIVMPRELTSYRDVVNRVMPAVVSIEAKATRRIVAPNRRMLPPGIPEGYRRFFEGDSDEAVPQPNLGFGSGFLIDPNGVIMTNSHVVDGADSVDVMLPDGRKFTTSDIFRDTKTDLAIVRIRSNKAFPYLEFGDSDAMEVGDRVLAIGAPYGLVGSVTQGIISAKSRQNLRLNQYEDFLQTDAAMNPGNSGGPLVNLEGRVIGINSAIKTRGGGSNGVGLAVSSNLAKDVSQQLLNSGVVKRGYLGVGVRDLDRELADRLGVPAEKNAVLITQVYENTPADKAGLQPGDVILSIGGTELKDVTTVPRVVSRLPLNEEAEVQYVRNGQVASARVTIEEQPEEFGRAPVVPTGSARVPVDAGLDVAGITVVDLTPQIGVQLGYGRKARGALILNVERGSNADSIGLMRGLLIVKVDRTTISSAKEFEQTIAAADADKGALLQVTRPTGESDFVVLKLK